MTLLYLEAAQGVHFNCDTVAISEMTRYKINLKQETF